MNRACLSKLVVLWLAFGIFVQRGSAQISDQTDLLAHDINGYALDMTVSQVEAIAHRPLESLGGGQYRLSFRGQAYDFGFSALGRLFRIDYQEGLGNFIPDEAYGRSLGRKLTEKFGPPHSNELPTGPVSWRYLEPYRGIGGQILQRDTLSLSVWMVGGWRQPIVLNMKLMDFRIMRRDIALANAAPRSHAEQATKF
jgi:hypothetical protein